MSTLPERVAITCLSVLILSWCEMFGLSWLGQKGGSVLCECLCIGIFATMFRQP